MTGMVPTSADRGDLLVMMRRQTNSAARRRMNALPPLDDGGSAAHMAAAGTDPGEKRLFVDATHPAYDAHPAARWIRRGRTATLQTGTPKSDHGRAHVALIGVLSRPDRTVVAPEAKLITGAEMVAFFILDPLRP